MAVQSEHLKITINERLNPSIRRTNRLEFDEAMMMSAVGISHRATCTRLAVGCILTANRHVVATGFNGAVKGEKHCLEVGCMLHEGHCIACVHAEANACMRCQWADTAYLTSSPCINCFKMMRQKGVERFLYWKVYRDPALEAYLYATYGVESNWPLSKVDDRLNGLLIQIDSMAQLFMQVKEDGMSILPTPTIEETECQ